MIKIALITMHKANNYGAVLQAYATQLVLKQYGEVSIVDYQNELVKNNFHLLRFEFSIHGLKMFFHDLLRLFWRRKVINKFNAFFKQKYHLTKLFDNKKILKDYFKDYNVFVSGSDQIWNPKVATKNGKIDSNYFLDFASNNALKFSYASSLGSHKYSAFEKEIVKDLLSDFSKISVREQDGVPKIKELLPQKDVVSVVDPTLLLTKQDWLGTIQKSSLNIDFPYILVYSVPRTPFIKKVVEFYKTKLKIKVVLLDQLLKTFCNADIQIRDAGIEDFIYLFNNASFVITDSFHGTCFALNFNKQFVSVAPHGKRNRIENLLSQVDLTERIVDENTGNLENLELDFSFVEPNKKLEQIRLNSLNFIRNVFE